MRPRSGEPNTPFTQAWGLPQGGMPEPRAALHDDPPSPTARTARAGIGASSGVDPVYWRMSSGQANRDPQLRLRHRSHLAGGPFRVLVRRLNKRS